MEPMILPPEMWSTAGKILYLAVLAVAMFVMCAVLFKE